MLAAVVKKKTGENVKDYLTPRLFEKIGINAGEICVVEMAKWN